MALSPTSSHGSATAVCHGPYTLAFNTAGLVNPVGNGIHFKTLTAGDLIVRVVAIPTSSWAALAPVTGVFLVGDPANWETNANDVFPHYLLSAGVSTGQEALRNTVDSPYGIGESMFLTAPATALGGYVYSDDSSPVTSGSMSVYVFTATPTLA